MNHTTGAQRHNKRQDKIWDAYKQQQAKIERLKKLYPDADEVADIIGWCDGTNPEVCEVLEQYENTQKFTEVLYQLASHNGNFEEAIRTNTRIAL